MYVSVVGPDKRSVEGELEYDYYNTDDQKGQIDCRFRYSHVLAIFQQGPVIWMIAEATIRWSWEAERLRYYGRGATERKLNLKMRA